MQLHWINNFFLISSSAKSFSFFSSPRSGFVFPTFRARRHYTQDTCLLPLCSVTIEYLPWRHRPCAKRYNNGKRDAAGCCMAGAGAGSMPRRSPVQQGVSDRPSPRCATVTRFVTPIHHYACPTRSVFDADSTTASCTTLASIQTHMHYSSSFVSAGTAPNMLASRYLETAKAVAEHKRGGHEKYNCAWQLAQMSTSTLGGQFVSARTMGYVTYFRFGGPLHPG